METNRFTALCFALLLVSAAAETASPRQCLIQENGIPCITVHLSKKTYIEAIDECRKIQSKLISIDSELKHNVLKRALASHSHFPKRFWIGLDDRRIEGVWIFQNGERLGNGYSAWSRTEPNGGHREDCVELMDATYWNDLNCTRQLSFICERNSENSCSYKDISIPNGYFTSCNEHTSAPSQHAFSFSCHQGYKPADDNTMVKCNDGNWEISTECVPVCSKPPVASNMRLLDPQPYYKVGEEVEIVCARGEGFFMKQNKPALVNSLKCVGINQWSSAAFECVSHKNFHLSNPSNHYSPIAVSVTEGEPLSLDCTKKNDQEHDIRYIWIKNDMNMETSTQLLKEINFTITETRQLKIYSTDEKALGKYTCLRANNKTNEFQSMTIFDVQTTIKNCHSNNENKSIQAHEKEFIILPCSSFKPYVTELIWKKDGIEIGYDDEHHAFLPEGSLLLKSISEEDSGHYRCEVYDRGSFCFSYENYHLSMKPTSESICGRLRKKGGDTQPWFASLWWFDEEKPFCYGGVISEQWILSTASCLVNIRKSMYSSIFIKIGFAQSLSEKGHTVNKLAVDSIHVHPRYSRRFSVNDIALIKLKTPLSLEGDVGVLCLMTGEIEKSLTYTRQCDSPRRIIGNVLGLGPLEGRNHSPKTDTMIVSSKDECSFETPTQSLFCAENNDKRTHSFGDLGSPFIVKVKERFYFYGIYSWGETMSNVGEHDYFTKNGVFFDWIKSHVK